MSRQRIAAVTAIAAGFWPALSACAADPAADGSQAPDLRHQAAPMPGLRLPGNATGLRLETGEPSSSARTGLLFDFETAPDTRPLFRAGDARKERGVSAAAQPVSRPGDFRHGSSPHENIGQGPAMAPSATSLRTGWQWSGRLGPLRWLSPLDEDGESTVRLGGRVQGQPRMPGMGQFNVGIHYTFE